MPLPRMSTRRWMFVVAAIAAGLTCWVLFQRSAEYRAKALRCADKVQMARGEAMRIEQRIARFADRPDDSRQARWAQELARSRAQVAHYSALRDKYLRLSSRPWLQNTPDPPSPAGGPIVRPPGYGLRNPP